jgi:hypothetical protein
VADTTNESYDHVLKNLSSTYRDAAAAIRNDFSEDLVRVASQIEAMVPAMEEFRGYDEGEQETRIVQAFDILKSDVEKHVTVRQQAELERKLFPAKIELDAEDLWATVIELQADEAPPYDVFSFSQNAEDTLLIAGIRDNVITEVGSVGGRILNADGEINRGPVIVSEDAFHCIAAEMHTDVSNSCTYAWGKASVVKTDDENVSGLEYEGVYFHNAEDIFQDLPRHLNRTAMDYMDQHSDTEGYPMKSETIVTNDSMEVSLAFAELGQNFDVKITKTVQDGAVRYEPFVANNLPQDEDLAAAVKDVSDALSGVVERYCKQATACGFDQDFTKIRGAEIKQEKPTVFSPPSSLSPATPSGGGIKRPSGLTAPGNRKPSAGGRFL